MTRECTQCLLKGAACVCCHVGNLFEWQDESVECEGCMQLYHGKCFAANDNRCKQCDNDKNVHDHRIHVSDK